MMMSDFITAVNILLAESIFLIALRVLIVVAAVKIPLGIVRNRSALFLAFLLWLAALVLYAVAKDDVPARLFVRFEALLCFGAVIGVGYAAYERLLGRWSQSQ